jgi:uncharacterized protein YuzE
MRIRNRPQLNTLPQAGIQWGTANRSIDTNVPVFIGCPEATSASPTLSRIIIRIEKWKKMKITYDKEVDAAYLKLSDGQPSGVIEISEGVNLDLTEDGKLIDIEILDTTKKFPLQTLFSCEYAKPGITGMAVGKCDNRAENRLDTQRVTAEYLQ